MKNVVMLVACLIVAASQTLILMRFLKRLKRIETDFWGESAEKAREELSKARQEELKRAKEAAETSV